MTICIFYPMQKCFDVTIIFFIFISQGKEIITEAGGLHPWMRWGRGMLTDSGGFQMVSLQKLAKITEQGVTFQNPYDSGCFFTIYDSIKYNIFFYIYDSVFFFLLIRRNL